MKHRVTEYTEDLNMVSEIGIFFRSKISMTSVSPCLDFFKRNI